MSSKGSERIQAFATTDWVDASKYIQFTGVAILPAADGGDTVTVQLRKATDDQGSNATNFGDAVTVTKAGSSPDANDTLRAMANGRNDELGKMNDGTQYTHVGMTISGGSPEVEFGMLLAFDPYVSTDAYGLPE